MSKKKFLMPNVQEFLEKKKIHDKKKDPIWVVLEREMKEMQEKGIKPYNETVGIWLRFLKDLKYYNYCQSKRIEKKLHREVGPPWYYELSISQRKVLKKLKFDIHQDLLENLPVRTRKALSDLGITLKFPRAVLMETMKNSVEDPGVFMWELYKAVYKQSPNDLRGTYDMNATIMMSSLVFIDLKECIESMKELLKQDAPPKPEPKPKKKTYYEPKTRYGSYLQKNKVPMVSNHGDDDEEKQKKPPPLEYRLKLKSDDSYEKLSKDMSFLEKRKERNRKAAQKERVCNYKFWEPPTTLRNTDPKLAAYMEKLKMMKLKAKAKYKSQFDNSQFLVSGVSYIRGRPQYILSSVALLPTGYIPINGGIVAVGEEYVTNILGYWKYPKDIKKRCNTGCDCLAKWEEVVTKYLKESKCKCGHLYDYYHTGVPAEKYFYPPSRTGPYWFDKAKIYQFDPMEDFIRDTARRAEKSSGTTVRIMLFCHAAQPAPSIPDVSAEGLHVKELAKTFLSDLSDTPLLIPHLPQAFLLNNVQEWVRRRVQGDLEPKQHKKLNLHAQRNWLNLKHMDFKARAYKIPFTQKQLHNMTWAHRKMIQQLFNKLMDDFVTRNRVKQLEQTRLWWSTMNHDAYPGKSFLDVFFTYMPGRMQDTYLINPFSLENTPKYGAKTCPLKF